MSKQIVTQAKADLMAAGIDLFGNNGAVKIVSEAASRIPGMGLVDKPQGNHADLDGGSYSVDGMMTQAGVFYDCLIDGGGANTPTFDQGDPIDPGRWRQPKSILAAAPPKVDQFKVDLIALYAEFGGVPTAAEIEAHRGNPGGLPAIRAMLEAARQQQQPPVVVPPAAPPPVVPVDDDGLVALIKAFIPEAVDFEQATKDSLLGLHKAIAAIPSTAYVKFDLKPVTGGGYTAYVKFDLKVPA